MASPDTNYQPESDIYTVLVVVAALFLVAGTVFNAMRSADLLGNWLPF